MSRIALSLIFLGILWLSGCRNGDDDGAQQPSVGPLITKFVIRDSTSGSPDYTNSTTVSVEFAESNTSNIVRWLLKNDPPTLDPPSENEMRNEGLPSRPTSWTLQPLAGKRTVAAWVMDDAGNISLVATDSIEYISMTGPGIVAPPGGFFVRPMEPLCIEVVGIEERIYWASDHGITVGNSPTAIHYNAGPGRYEIFVK